MEQEITIICDRCKKITKDCKDFARISFRNTKIYNICPQCFNIFVEMFLNDFLRSEEEYENDNV